MTELEAREIYSLLPDSGLNKFKYFLEECFKKLDSMHDRRIESVTNQPD